MSFLSRGAFLRPALRSTSSLLSLGPARRALITLQDNLYTVTATSTGGRDGTISSTPTDETAPLNLKLTPPKVLGGRGDRGHNPEQLFAAGYSACFLGAIQVAATKLGKREVGARAVVHADVTLGRPTDRPGFGLKVLLRVEGVEDQAILDAAHEMCPYSRALSEGVVVDVEKA
ncbi:OsmC-like protein [Russula ochroleuca]|jgi:Ohr subfamily peroxiredoxin|uniref:OsmC-like protein n=1 Tax=Russula ochroleuca TaxID=152965 RepID=A0A9P5N0E6_9AGAM|nr:OsmC-like protein [Russula ochroleuca]